VSSRPVRIEFTRRAAAEIAKAERWWREHRPAARGAIAEDLARGIELLALQPSIGIPAAATRLRGVRRILLDRVGYHVYFRFDGRKRVLTIVAFWHSRRESGPEAAD
jgi:plasmid stabilization system protein ParE